MATAVFVKDRSSGTARFVIVMVFAASVFVSAFLLFSIQPIIAKLLLPLLGGSPAVWNTCMLFFQTTLLLGYIYVFLISRWNLGVQLALQILLLTLATVTLPITVTPSWANSVPAAPNPTYWLLGCLIVLVGLPFFIISTNGPMLQKWFSESGLASEPSPYVLYSVSNAGSLLALLLYPVLIERHLSLQSQTRLWSAFYVLLVLIVSGCALVLWRSNRVAADVARNATLDGAETKLGQPTNKQRWQWVSLAFVPSTLMYGVTNYISTDIAAVPLIWIIPLGLYLLTLVIAFAGRQLISFRIAHPIVQLATIGLLSIYLSNLFTRALFLILIHLIYFVLVALVFHTQLANIKPPARYLADFYIWLCVGGALGGVFNCLIAPTIFRSIVEYPFAIALSCLLLPAAARENDVKTVWLDLVVPVSMLVLTLALGLSVHRFLFWPINGMLVAMLVPFVISYFLQQRSFGFGLAVIAVTSGAGILIALNSRSLLRDRNFFGVVRVVEERNMRRTLLHGTTTHGQQSTETTTRCEPLSYYHRQGPLGSVFAAFDARSKATNVAIIGLGTGATAAYVRPNHHWTFYEINPAVVAIAMNPQYFTYLSRCAERPVEIVMGDARLKLKEAQDAHYDLIVMDAFNSDSIPVHLLTQEALDLYLAKLAPGGLIAFHISNVYLDLGPVIADLASSRGLQGIELDDTKASEIRGKDPSRWIVLARTFSELSSLEKFPDARVVGVNGQGVVWTDDFSNILGAFRWH